MHRHFGLCPFMAVAMVATGFTMSADRIDEATGTTDAYTWEYWNDFHADDGSYWPNWKINFTPELTEAPANVAINYVLKKGAEVVTTGAANATGASTTTATAYCSLGILEAGDYMMESTVTLIKAADPTPIIAVLTPVNFTVAAAPTDKPKAVLEYEVVNGPEKALLNYEIKLENIAEENVESYRVWLDAPGNVLMGEGTTKSGSIEVDVTDGDHTYWMKGQVVYTDGGETKTINTTPNDLGVDFRRVADPSTPVPTIDLTASNPVALSATTGTIDFTITTDKPDLEGVSYRVYCVTTGDKMLGEMTTTDLTGTLELSNLNYGTVTDLWVKAQATVGANQSNEAQFPGAPQNWTGLSIDTSAFYDPEHPVMPTFTLVASNPVKTGDTTGTLDYEVTLASNKYFKSLDIYVVTNAFGGDDVVLAHLDATTELKGTLDMTGLKPGVVNGLWVKAKVTITTDEVSEELTYPGAAQGWTGLEIDMSQSAISAIDADAYAPVEYFTIQGVRVDAPVNGLYIRRQGGKVSKIVVR